MMQYQIKISFVFGLKELVIEELLKHVPEFVCIEQTHDTLYIEYFENFEILKNLKSVSKVFLVISDEKYNPKYICKHKSILGELITEVIDREHEEKFKNFKISCAGQKSKEVKEISRYIIDTFKLELTEEESDLKIHMSKMGESWEVGLQITTRPLSVRKYKIQNLSGAIDPTIAYAINSLTCTQDTHSYLNIFSGSATFLIEAAQEYPNINTLIGFDNNKEHISYSIQNIRKAGFIKKIQIKEFNIFDNPDLGKFDVITSDLPFGMSISKKEDLEKLYRHFISYAQKHLNSKGYLAVYTSNFEMLEGIINESNFSILKKIALKIITVQGLYLSTCAYICQLK
jgi:tRNA (guanine6-N2)-methyltransferase